jgi:hypothetical protein
MAACVDCGKQVQDSYERCYSCHNESKKKDVSYDQPNEASEGELFLREYLESEGIKYKTEVQIKGLKKDSKTYRIADFYLPNYKLYIEFLGKWFVSDNEKNRYREKKKVYEENNIPCIFLYPENLGIIEFILPTRAIKEFKKHKLTKELWMFRLKFLWLYKREYITLFLFLFFVFVWADFTWKEDLKIKIGLIVILLLLGQSVYSFYKKKLA